MPSKAWDEITYPFLNFNGCTVEVQEWISNFIPHYNGCDYLSMLGLKLNHVSKRGPWNCTPEINDPRDQSRSDTFVSDDRCLIDVHPMAFATVEPLYNTVYYNTILLTVCQIAGYGLDCGITKRKHSNSYTDFSVYLGGKMLFYVCLFHH